VGASGYTWAFRVLQGHKIMVGRGSKMGVFIISDRKKINLLVFGCLWGGRRDAGGDVRGFKFKETAWGVTKAKKEHGWGSTRAQVFSVGSRANVGFRGKKGAMKKERPGGASRWGAHALGLVWGGDGEDNQPRTEGGRAAGAGLGGKSSWESKVSRRSKENRGCQKKERRSGPLVSA